MAGPEMNLRLAPEAVNAVAELYHELDADIAARKPICTMSGRCCKFESWGHRLYVTALELGYFEHLQNQAEQNDSERPSKSVRFPLPLYAGNGNFSPGCPWQVEGLCTARQSRPLGCRIYFCDSSSTVWQQDIYEKYHRRLGELHRQFEIPYEYLEWREALAVLDRHEPMGDAI
jgi:Fe-S-cluster containining protein